MPGQFGLQCHFIHEYSKRKRYTVCRGGKHYRYKQVFLFDHALHKKFSVSLQYLVIKKVNFCSKLKLMKSALLRIYIVYIVNSYIGKNITF